MKISKLIGLRTDQLWQKLALAFIGVALTAIAVAYILMNYVIDNRFEGYLNQREKEVYHRIGTSLAAAYAESGGWNNRLTQALPHFAVMNRIDIEIHNVRGRLVTKAPFGADETQNREIQRQLGFDKLLVANKNQRVVVPIIVRRTKVGYISVSPLIVTGELTDQQKFRLWLNSSLWVGGFLAALISLALSYVISVRMTRPLGSVARAAKGLENGDLTQRVEVTREDEIGQLGEAFNHLAETLECQERMRKNMTADIAHELRTPLAVIRSLIEAYLDGVMIPDTKSLQSLHEETMRLGRLVDDLGALARAEGGRLELKRKDADLSSLVEDAAFGLRPFFQERDLTLEVSTEPEIIGCFDADKIKQVVVNLLSNAAKFTPPGGKVDVGVFAETDGTARIIVKDTGIGIDPGSLPHVFERFFRADKSRSRETGGSGIGLTIVDELVKLHSGSVKVESDVNEGSTFTVILPAKLKKLKIHNSRTASS